MKRLFVLLSFIVLVLFSLSAQFYVTNGVKSTDLDVSLSGIDEVFVFNNETGSSGSGVIGYTASNVTDFSWYQYSTSPSSKVWLKTENNTTTTSLDDLTPGGYILEFDSEIKYVWVFDEKDYQFQIDSVSAYKSSTPCTTVIVNVAFTKLPAMYYYNEFSVQKTLDRKFEIKYNTLSWDDSSLSYLTEELTDEKTASSYSNSPFSIDFEVDAPYTNTYFRVVGDQFMKALNIQLQAITSSLYETVAVTQNMQGVVSERESLNEIDRTSGTLGGSAPLVIAFTSNANIPIAKNFEWYFVPTDNPNNSVYYSDTDLRYTFKNAGLYTVKLRSSNEYCSDFDSLTVTVVESYLEVPNVFTPNGDGKNDEFRVAYKSLISFHGVVYNRWGRKVFSWSDPGKGWDGRINGKMANPGPYYYIIEAVGADYKTNSKEHVKYKKKGDINLIRGK